MGRGKGWSSSLQAVVKQDLSDNRSIAYIAKTHGWGYSGVKKLVRRIRQGEELQYRGAPSRLRPEDHAILQVGGSQSVPRGSQ